MIIIIILVYVIIAVFQGFSLIKKGDYRELITFSILWGFSFLLTFIFYLGIDIPSPALFVKYIVEDLLHLKYPV